MARNEDQAGVRFPPPLVFLGFLLLGLLIGALVGRIGFGINPTLRLWAGIALFGIGLAIVFAAIGRFREAGTKPEPWEPTTAIVETGIYARTRNPMYLAMALAYAGLALMTDSVIALLLLPAAVYVIQTQVIAREERYLEGKFGEAYRGYQSRVRRWL